VSEKEAMNFPESKIQQSLIQWCRWQKTKFPELQLIHAVPNGGFRHPKEAARLIREGVLAGIPDLFLPVARQSYYGLYLETKAPQGKLSPAQIKMHTLLKAQNYAVLTFYSLDQGVQILTSYLTFEARRDSSMSESGNAEKPTKKI
jgi:hypothetical protein